jgi:hypothetical protein
MNWSQAAIVSGFSFKVAALVEVKSQKDHNTYNIPPPGGGIWKAIFGYWSTDSIVNARSAPPVNVVTGLAPFGGMLSGA